MKQQILRSLLIACIFISCNEKTLIEGLIPKFTSIQIKQSFNFITAAHNSTYRYNFSAFDQSTQIFLTVQKFRNGSDSTLVVFMGTGIINGPTSHIYSDVNGVMKLTVGVDIPKTFTTKSVNLIRLTKPVNASTWQNLSFMHFKTNSSGYIAFSPYAGNQPDRIDNYWGWLKINITDNTIELESIGIKKMIPPKAGQE